MLPNEWFVTDLETVKNAIKAVKDGKDSLNIRQISADQNPIIFRPEQREAIEKTKKQFKKSNEMLFRKAYIFREAYKWSYKANKYAFTIEIIFPAAF